MEEDEAVEALKHLGLSEYESKVFIALQRLGRGTAREVYELTDVPRSQVYGAAESLEERGLVEVQRSKPMEYRAVDLDEARSRLEQRFESEEQTAFDYIEAVREQEAATGERRQDLWTVKGSDSIDVRLRSLVEDAQQTALLIATDASLVSREVERALREGADGDVEVYVMSEDPDVCDRFDGTAVVAFDTPERLRRDDDGGRFLMVDSSTVLMSVVDDGSGDETAIWSRETGFATVLVQIAEGWLEAENLFD
ncbi:MAG: TrmB family transcriptional regulator [Halobacteriales archaeon]